MYKMKADGVVFYDPSSDDMALHVLSPKAKYELNKAGSLEFTMLPGNVMYDGLNKMKTIVTLEQDGEEIFRGRVIETETDLYNQKKVYCEGELAYLLDSTCRPYEYNGSAKEYLPMLIANHNADVEEHKHFTVGLMTALSDDDTVEVESENYVNTLEEIKSLLVDEFNGYLRVRWEDGVRYLDYVDKFDQECSQEINFGVNLVDIETTVNAQDVCSVLIPVGRSSKGVYTDVSEVNDGKDYIEDETLIAKYGRIVKSYTFDDVEDPEEILALGKEHMEKMAAETTLTIKAVDLHTVGADVDGIRLGDTVKLVSAPHGLDKEDVCTKIDLDIENPEKSEYTFGMPQETLTDNNASASRKNSRSTDHTHKWLRETDTALTINVEATNLIGHRTTQLEIDVDAAEEAITLKANQSSVDILEDRTSSAEIRLDAAESAIDLKAERKLVEEQGERLSTAEIRLDAAESAIELKASADELNSVSLRLDAAEKTITAKADLVRVEAIETEITGLLKVENLSAAISELGEVDVNELTAGTTQTISLYVHGGAEIGGFDFTSHSHAVTVDGGIVTLGEVSSTGGSFNIADTQFYKDGVSAAKDSVELTSAGWMNGTNIVNASNGKSMTVNLPGFSSSGGTTWVDNKTTIYFTTDSVNAPLLTVEVDATSVYEAGYEAGMQAAKDAVTLDAAITAVSNTAANTFHAQGYARVYIDGEQVAYTTLYKTQTINVGQ